MAGDPLAAHVRDELGFSEELATRPLQAALTSAASFVFGALIPLLALLLAPSGPLRRGGSDDAHFRILAEWQSQHWTTLWKRSGEVR